MAIVRKRNTLLALLTALTAVAVTAAILAVAANGALAQTPPAPPPIPGATPTGTPAPNPLCGTPLGALLAECDTTTTGTPAPTATAEPPTPPPIPGATPTGTPATNPLCGTPLGALLAECDTTPTGTPGPNATAEPPTPPPIPGGSPTGTPDPNAPPTPPGRTAAPTPTPTPQPQPPTDVEARNGERAGEVVLSWTPAGNPTFYRIGWLPYAEYEAARAADRPWLDAFAYQDVVNTDRRSRHTLKGLQPGVAYAFVVAPAGSRFGPTPSRTWSEWAVLTLHNPAECPDAENPSPTPIPSPTPTP